MVVEFKARRDLIVAGLNEIPGIRCATPLGAFYAFPSIAGTGLSGAELAERLLHEAGVCVLAGTAFGGVGTEHIRISYANSRENLTEALGADRALRRGPRSWLTATPTAVFVARRHPRGGARRRSAPRARWTSGRTSCRRRATSCCAGSPAAMAC